MAPQQVQLQPLHTVRSTSTVTMTTFFLFIPQIQRGFETFIKWMFFLSSTCSIFVEAFEFKLEVCTYITLWLLHIKAIVMVWRFKNIQTVSMSKYFWICLYLLPLGLAYGHEWAAARMTTFSRTAFCGLTFHREAHGFYEDVMKCRSACSLQGWTNQGKTRTLQKRLKGKTKEVHGPNLHWNKTRRGQQHSCPSYWLY